MIDIPLSLLPHTVTHGYNLVKDARVKVTASSTRTVEHVCVQPSSKIVIGKDNTEIQLQAIMWYSKSKSTPTGVTFVKGDTITFGGAVYTIESIEPLYEHHVEMGLS